jgi:hypothetical protein
MLHYQSGPNGLNLNTLPYTPLLALDYLIFMLPTAFVVGVPSYFLLKRAGWFNGWSVLSIGAASGMAWAIPVIGYKPPPYNLVLFFGLGGFIASAVFWLLFARANNSFKRTAAGRLQ